MATSISSKRPVVLSLGELQRYPTIRSRYEITVPFNVRDYTFQNPLRCNCPAQRPDGMYNFACQGCDVSFSFAKLKAKAVEQTEKRWVWFSEARRLDDRLGRRLGTLGLLPLEIREMIWCAAIDDYKDMFEWWDWNEYGSWRREEPGQKVEETWLHLPLTFKIPHEWNPSQRHDNVTRLDVFDLQSYHDSEEVQGCTMHLRYVSPEVKIELERTFIFTHAFRFLCPTLLDHFLNQLLAHHRLLLRSINLRIFGCYDSYSCGQNSIESECRAWVAVIERLPATLQFVTFELGWLGVRLFNPGLWGTRMSRDIRTTMKAVALLEVLTKKIQRQAPNAKVSLAGLDWLCVEDREMLQTMLDEVGPHSEEFKKWLVQTRKNAMD